MLCKRLLLFRERDRDWSRFCFRYNSAFRDRSRRRGNTIRGVGASSEYAFPCGRNRDSSANRLCRDLLSIHAHDCLSYRLRAYEGALRNRRDGILHVSVHVGHVRDVGGVLDDGGVVDIRDGRGIDCRIADVHTIHIPATHAVRRYVDFTGPERKPSDISVKAVTTLSNENNQCWSVNGSHGARAGNPTPSVSNRYPASVVKRRIAPCSVF